MLEDLYTCIALSGDATRLEAEVQLHAGHPVFGGHFPGRPVLPGVCQMHLVKELLEKHLGRSLRCKSVRELKFLSPVIPSQETLLRVVLVLTTADDGSIGVQGIISVGVVQKTKIKATFVSCP